MNKRSNKRLLATAAIVYLYIIPSFYLSPSRAESDTLYASCEEVLTRVREFRTKRGYPPTFNDYESFIAQVRPNEITVETPALIQKEIILQQRPSIKETDLLKITISKRNSIKDYRIKYKVTVAGNTMKMKISSPILREYVFKKGMYYLDTNLVSTKTRDIISYDGKRILKLRQLQNLPNQGGIQQHESLGIFVDPWMPLTLSGLFDTQGCGDPDYQRDLVLFLEGVPLTLPDGTEVKASPYVFEKVDTIENYKCISVSGISTCKYLALDYDFSVVQWETYSVKTSKLPNGQVIPGRTLRARAKYQDLFDCGNSIWLPHRIVIEYYNEHGTKDRVDTIEILSAEINKGIDDSFFSDFIPEDTIISDSINNMVYKWSNRASINSLLKDVVKSKRAFFYRYLSMSIGLAMIIIAVVVKYRRYRKQMGTGEW